MNQSDMQWLRKVEDDGEKHEGGMIGILSNIGLRNLRDIKQQQIKEAHELIESIESKLASRSDEQEVAQAIQFELKHIAEGDKARLDLERRVYEQAQAIIRGSKLKRQ